MKQARDDRSRQAIAYHWASRVTSISLEMVLPGLIGYWLDQKFNTNVIFTILGFGGGLTLGMMHLIQLAQSSNAAAKRSKQAQTDGKTDRANTKNNSPGETNREMRRGD